MRYQGRIISWKDKQGFGFIAPNGGGEKVFVHARSFGNRQRRPGEMQIVTYELKPDARGRARAENVAFAGDRPAPAASAGRGRAAVILSAAFLAFIGGAAIAGKLPSFVLWLYLVSSTAAFVGYMLDKSAAKNNRRRIRERTLHLFALAGGWPGALAAQTLLRHKSAKPSFQPAFRATVIGNCGVLGWFFSAPGAAMLQSVAGPW